MTNGTASEVGVALGRQIVSTPHPSPLPVRGGEGEAAHVVVLAEPVGVVEGRVGEDVVGAEIGREIAAESVAVRGAVVGLDAAQGEVHNGEAAGGGVAFLAVDADVAKLAAVGFDEFFRLHEHAAGAAGGVVDAAFVGGEHLDEAADDAGRRVELAAVLALGAGEHGQEVFVDPAQDIDAAVGSWVGGWYWGLTTLTPIPSPSGRGVYGGRGEGRSGAREMGGDLLEDCVGVFDDAVVLEMKDG